jgi:cysteine-rich repeat protein
MSTWRSSRWTRAKVPGESIACERIPKPQDAGDPTGSSNVRSACVPRCGDGVIASGEECDDGEANADTAYGGCTTLCTFGPFCGDGIVNGDEECDNGVNASLEARVAAGCAPGCKLPTY